MPGILRYTCEYNEEHTYDEEIFFEKPVIKVKNLVYSGKKTNPVLSVSDQYGWKLQRSQYQVTLPKSVSVGTHQVTVKTISGFYGIGKVTFKILPQGTSLSKLKPAKKAMTVIWKKQTRKMAAARVTGYQIRYSLKSSMKGAITKTAKGYKRSSLKIQKLKKKKTYYVQIRTYMKTGGKVYYSAWSKKKAVKVK